MKKILILTANFGSGHNVAAKNLKNIIERNIDEVEVKIEDVFDIEKKSEFKWMSEVYDSLTSKMKAPYNLNYYLSYNIEGLYKLGINEVFMKKKIDKVESLIMEYNPDEVITVFSFAGLIASNIRKKGNLDFKIISVLTDFTKSKEWIYDDIDMYLLPDETIKNKYIKYGIGREKLFVTGPIVELETEKKEYREEIKNVLIVLDKMSTVKITKKDIDYFNKCKDVKFRVVCGRNEEAYEKLNKYSSEKLEVIGFTKELKAMMDDADLLVTKPGGLIVYEALKKGVPLAIVDSNVGQEKENYKFILNNGLGIEIDGWYEFLSHICKNKKCLNSVSENVRDKREEFKNNLLAFEDALRNDNLFEKRRGKMNIGIFTDTYEPQINEVSVGLKYLVNDLESKGHNVYVFTVKDKVSVKEEGVYRFFSVPFLPYTEQRVAMIDLWKAYKISKKLKLDIVHTHTEFSLGIIGKWVANMLKVPHIHSTYKLYEEYAEDFKLGFMPLPNLNITKKITNKYCDSADVLIAPTEKIKTKLKEFGIKKDISVIANGVDISRFEGDINPADLYDFKTGMGLKESDKVILFLGRLSKEKNVHELLELMVKIKDDNVKLLVVGDGPEKENLVKMSDDMNLESKVIFTGKVSNEEVKLYYKIADIFVSTSSSETQALTFIEALAAGTPVLVRDDKINNLKVDNKKDFIFTDSNDLYNKVTELVRDEEKKMKLKELAEDVSAKFNVSNTAEKILEVYSKEVKPKVDEGNRVLILTASTGAGHKQAASNLKREYEEEGYVVEVYDFIKETSSFLNLVIADFYEVLAMATPRIYGALYNFSNNEHTNDIFVKNVIRMIERKIVKRIENFDPNIIIGTHTFSVAAVSKLKKKGKIDVPFMSVVTDFKAHYTYVDETVDAYVTGSEYTRETLVEKNIDSCKVFPFGIPIDRKFKEKIIFEKENNDYFSILLMGGSMGLNGIEDILKELANNENKLEIKVVCGRNEKLKSELDIKYTGKDFKDKNIEIIGFTKQINELMEKADLLVSKPGGLTVTEAIVKNVPMIIPFAIPGQEEENTEFLVDMELAMKINEPTEINEVINEFVENPDKLSKMRDKMYEVADSYSIKNIIELSDSLIKSKN
ncbi:MAG: glycosyltransferase [Clostridia bacterium]|nr:glycosyltransferase [Clostridia bacterium]